MAILSWKPAEGGIISEPEVMCESFEVLRVRELLPAKQSQEKFGTQNAHGDGRDEKCDLGFDLER